MLTRGATQLVGLILVIAIALMILKWLLITAAIVAMPFTAWWLYDHYATRPTRKGQHSR